ncbi:MAG: hypothetical protein ACYDDV_02725 [Methanoregula sp.]
MPNIDEFTLKDMVEVSVALRRMGEDAASMEEVADKIVHYLHDHLIDKKTGEKACVLVRFFKTYPYSELDAGLQEFARSVMNSPPDSPAMKCMVLLASAGTQPEWNSRKQSRGHKAIPLPSERFVETLPMVRQLIQQMGLDIKTVIQPDLEIIRDMTKKTNNVFSVPEAVGSKYVPDQDTFVIPYKVRSVIGFGGILPTGNLFAIILFSKVPVPQQTADMFRSLALSVKIAILPFVGRKLFT